MTKKKFYIIFSVYLLLLFVWYMFIYLPQLQKLDTINIKLGEVSQKVAMARNAKVNLENIKKHFNQEQKYLQKEKERFVKREELGKVIVELRKLARKFNLKLVDFSPGLKDYFTEKDQKIVSLPVSITFIGDFISVGKFMDAWREMPFYLIPEEVTMERVDKSGRDIQTVVQSKLYIWNE